MYVLFKLNTGFLFYLNPLRTTFTYRYVDKFLMVIFTILQTVQNKIYMVSFAYILLNPHCSRIIICICGFYWICSHYLQLSALYLIHTEYLHVAVSIYLQQPKFHKDILCRAKYKYM